MHTHYRLTTPTQFAVARKGLGVRLRRFRLKQSHVAGNIAAVIITR